MVKNVNCTARLQWKVDTIKNCIYLQCSSNQMAHMTTVFNDYGLNKPMADLGFTRGQFEFVTQAFGDSPKLCSSGLAVFMTNLLVQY